MEVADVLTKRLLCQQVYYKGMRQLNRAKLLRKSPTVSVKVLGDEMAGRMNGQVQSALYQQC
jgi:hypothetical protein